MLYSLLRKLSRIATEQFFAEIHYTGESAVERGPLLIVANHPAVVLDGLLVLSAYQRVIWFVAKATLFRSKIASRLLRSLLFVPIQRRQDDPEKIQDNQSSFRFICDTLFSGQALLIFPEGQSLAMRQILPVKTGAARIAFQAEHERDFTLGLRIQAVGLTYSDFQRFRSSVTLTFGKPIEVSEYRDQYYADPVLAVKSLSLRIQQDLKRLTAEVFESQQVSLVEKIAKLYRSRGLGQDDRQRMEAVARNVERLGPKMPEYARRMEQRITLYLHLAAAFRLDASEDFELEKNPLFVALLCPLVLLGVFINYPLYRLVNRIGESFSQGRRSQRASYALSFAFILFPAWYLLLGALFAQWQSSAIAGILFTGLMFAAGWAVVRYLQSVSVFLFSTFWPARRSPISLIKEMRDLLIEELDHMRLEN